MHSRQATIFAEADMEWYETDMVCGRQGAWGRRSRTEGVRTAQTNERVGWKTRSKGGHE